MTPLKTPRSTSDNKTSICWIILIFIYFAIMYKSLIFLYIQSTSLCLCLLICLFFIKKCLLNPTNV